MTLFATKMLISCKLGFFMMWLKVACSATEAREKGEFYSLKLEVLKCNNAAQTVQTSG